MDQSSLPPNSADQKPKDGTTPVLSADTPSPPPKRVLYFTNEVVEDLLRKYIWTGCTDVSLRNQIMSHASELIRQIIRKQGLHTIYTGQEESSFNDLLQVGWTQVERVLYKFRARPHCRTCYNPDRPSDSLLYNPGPLEYGVISHEELAKKGIKKCPKCSTVLRPLPEVKAEQDVYGGSTTVLYRGPSKVFNMWCVAPGTHTFGCCGVTTIDAVVNAFADGRHIHVHGLDGVKAVQAVKSKGLTNTLVVKTALSYGVECSKEHQLLALRPDGPVMVEAKKLKVGDLLAVQSGQWIFGDIDNLDDIKLKRGGTKNGEWVPPATMTPELAYIIGLFIAEGSYSYGKMVIYNVDREVIKALCQNKLGLNFIPEPEFQRISLCNVRFIEFLQVLGFPEHTEAWTKHIPERLLAMSRLNMLAMLSGMFDGDGHSSRHKGNVGYTTTSQILLNQVRMLLLNMGLMTRIGVDKRTSREFKKKNGKTHTSQLHGSWQIHLSTTESAKFYDLISFGIVRKQRKLKKLPNSRELFYGFNDAFRRLKAKYGCGKLGFNKLRRALKAKQCTIATARLVSNWDAHSDDKDYQFIQDRLAELTRTKDRIVWLPIRSITPSKSELREISVDSQTHTYIANGIVSHNSQIARTVILAHIKKEGKDRKNSGQYRDRIMCRSKPFGDKIIRLLVELKDLCKHNKDHLTIIDAISHIIETDSRPYDGIISKLVKHTKLPRLVVSNFIWTVRLRSNELSDAPINRGNDGHGHLKRPVTETDED